MVQCEPNSRHTLSIYHAGTKAVRREKDPSKRTLYSRTLRAQCVHMSHKNWELTLHKVTNSISYKLSSYKIGLFRTRTGPTDQQEVNQCPGYGHTVRPEGDGLHFPTCRLDLSKIIFKLRLPPLRPSQYSAAGRNTPV